MRTSLAPPIVKTICLLVIIGFEFAGFCQASALEGTNRIFRLGSIGKDVPKDDLFELAVKGSKGKFALEFLPAENDPGGNWGQATNGVQISVRFYQTNFILGHPVEAVVLIRNVGEAPLNFMWAAWVHYSCNLTMRLDGETLLPRIPRVEPDVAKHDGSAGTDLVFSGTQKREVLRLDKIFDLSRAGTYEIVAERKGVRSGTAKFEIVPKPAEP